MTCKHSPGPWKLDGGEGQRGELYVWTDRRYPRGICVAVVQPNARCEGDADFAEEEIEANARLIAAAPDFLAAAEAILEYADGGSPVHPGADVVADLRAAVRRAKEGGR
jgi:hypothetical protein